MLNLVTKNIELKNAFIAWLVGAIYAFYFSVPASTALSIMYIFKPSYGRTTEYFMQVNKLFYQPISETVAYLGMVTLFTSPIFIILLIVGLYMANFRRKYPVGLPVIAFAFVYAASVAFYYQRHTLAWEMMDLTDFLLPAGLYIILTSAPFVFLSPLIVSTLVFTVRGGPMGEDTGKIQN